MPTSSANPDKLQQYSEDGLELIATLKSKSSAVSESIGALRPSSGTGYVPALGETDSSFKDLADDWYHLDEFVGDVAKGFREAGRDPDGDGVYTALDADIRRRGQVGYADRDAAIREANAMAAELRRLRDKGHPTVDEMLEFARMAEKGQYDPAFAVAFSEAVGVDGYNDATALIRRAYEEAGNDTVSPEGLAAVGMLAQTMTTALDTLPGIARSDRHDPDNARLGDDERLGQDFVRNLTSAYQPRYGPHSSRNGPNHPDEYPWATTADLSVLLGMTDPPTNVAVDIANHRMTPELLAQLDEKRQLSGTSWGDHGGIVTNYAEMLGRNSDASTLWLNSRGGVNRNGEPSQVQNIDLVIQRPSTSYDLDGGYALADVVEVGLTNPDLPDQRRDLMDRTIDMAARQEIKNDYMNGALASGVESNMDVIDRRINSTFVPKDDHGNVDFREQLGADHLGLTRKFADTEAFLSKLLGDPDTAGRVRTATSQYVQEGLNHLPVGADGERPSSEMKDLGRILGTARDADISAVVADVREETDAAARRQRLADWMVGLLPYGGPANTTSAAFIDRSIGDLAANPPDQEAFERRLWGLTNDLTNHIEDKGMVEDDTNAMKTGVSDIAKTDPGP